MPYTFVTGVTLLRAGDAIAPRCLNWGSTLEATRLRAFAVGGGSVADTGDVKVSPRNEYAMSHSVARSGDYWVEIETSAETMVPDCYFARATPSGVEIIVLYRPGDFAVFDPAGKRLW